MHKLRTICLQAAVAAVIASLVAGWQSAHLEKQARAEPRRVTPQEPDQHFKSGGRLSESVLQEILVVLKRIDERLERLERFSEQPASGNRGTSASPAAGDEVRQTPSSQIQVKRSR